MDLRYLLYCQHFLRRTIIDHDALELRHSRESRFYTFFTCWDLGHLLVERE